MNRAILALICLLCAGGHDPVLLAIEWTGAAAAVDVPVVLPDPRPQFEPAVAANATGYLVVWRETGITGGGNLRGARVSSDGRVIDPGGIAIGPGVGEQSFPAVAAGRGDFLVVWQEGEAGSRDILGVRIEGASGSELDADPIPICRAAADQSAPAVAALGDGYLVVWEDARNRGAGAGIDLYGVRISAEGMVMDDPPIPVAVGEGDQKRPDLAAVDEAWMVVWHDLRTGVDFDTLGVRITGDGTVLDADAISIGEGPGSQWNPSVAYNGGQFLVVWQDRAAGLYHDLFGRRLDAGGTIIDAEPLVVAKDPEDGVDRVKPEVTAEGNGFVVVWEDGRHSTEFSNRDIYSARISEAGGMGGEGGVAVSLAVKDQRAPRVAAGPHGVLAVWEDFRNGRDNDIFGQWITGEAQTGAGESDLKISTRVNGQRHPRVAANNDVFLAVWEDDRNGTDWDIYGMRISVASGTALDSTALPIGAAHSQQQWPAVTFANGEFYVVWQDFRNGVDFELYGARVSAVTGEIEPMGNGGRLVRAERNQVRPAVAGTPSGALLLWQDERIATDQNLMAQWLGGEDGEGSEPVPLSFAPGHQHDPAVAVAGAGFLAVWVDQGETEGESEGEAATIHAARVTRKEGVLVVEPPVVVSAEIGDYAHPAVAGSGADFLVAWEHRTSTSPLASEIQSRVIRGAGRDLLPPGDLISWDLEGRPGFEPMLGGHGFGYVAGWSERRADGASDSLLRVMRLGDTGRRPIADTPAQIAIRDAGEFHPAVAGSNGNLIGLYELPSAGGEPRLYYRILSLDPLPHLSVPGGELILDPPLDEPVRPAEDLALGDAAGFAWGGASFEVGLIAEASNPGQLRLVPGGDPEVRLEADRVIWDGAVVARLLTPAEGDRLHLRLAAGASHDVVPAVGRRMVWDPPASGGVPDDVVVSFELRDSQVGFQTRAYRLLRIRKPPLLVASPESRVAEEGDSVAWRVEAEGGMPMHFQWAHNGTVIPTATYTSFTIPAASLAATGEYRVTVTNTWGQITSPPAELILSTTNRCFSAPPNTDPFLLAKSQPDDPQWHAVSPQLSSSTETGHYCLAEDLPYRYFRLQDGPLPLPEVSGRQYLRTSIRIEGASVRLDWKSLPDLTYFITAKRHLQDPRWIPVAARLRFDQNGWYAFPIDQEFHFFRVGAGFIDAID